MRFSILMIAGAALVFSACNQSDKQEQTLRLWYDEPAEQWTDALPIGNGRLGGMVFGGVEKDRIQFNEETLWTGEPRDYSREGASAYLDEIRKLLFEGKQEEAEKLAAEQFMGRRSNEGDFDELRRKWLQNVRTGDNLTPAGPAYDDGDWKELDLPTADGWEKEGLEGLDGAVWFRTTFEAPESWANKSASLHIGRVRDLDFTYVNGHFLGSTEGNDDRSYIIPQGIVKPGKNIVAIQTINYDNKGGIVRSRMPMAVIPENAENDGVSLQKSWKYFIQDHNPPAFPQFMASYQPFGDLWLTFHGHAKPSGYERELDIANAIARTRYVIDDVEYRREYFVSAPDQAIVTHLKSSRGGMINVDAGLGSPHIMSNIVVEDPYTLTLDLSVRDGALKGSAVLKVVTKNGTVNASSNTISIRNADEATLYITAGTSFKNYQDISGDAGSQAMQAMNDISGKSYDRIREDHVDEYRSYFDNFDIVLGKGDSSHLATDERIMSFSQSSDHALMSLYVQYGRYLMIASSRPGTQPANLQGIWNDMLRPPWGSKYTCNINVEMNYWPAELLNLSPMHEPLFGLIYDLSETGSETARDHYDAGGWVSHHNTDLWRGSGPVNASNHGIWVTGGAWLSHHLWERYAFTMDEDFLREKAYPVMKESAEFFTDFLIEDPKTGWLISTPSNSPENGGLVAGPAMDHQIIRSLFKKTIAAAEKLGVDEGFRAKLNEKLSKIAPDQIGRHGQLQEWLQDVDDPNNKHRHVSHLWAVYPGDEITSVDEDVMNAARQSLVFRGDEGTGWSLAWKINLWARFLDGDHSYKLVQTLLSPAENPVKSERGGSYRNLFDAHPPFQIDGNFGGAAGIVEMLIQSHEGRIELLPALPSELTEGEIKGVCARGGFVMDFSWSEGKLKKVNVLSKAGEMCSLKYGDRLVQFETSEGREYDLDGNLERM